jgi:membrane associated rhomboid family serine protease
MTASPRSTDRAAEGFRYRAPAVSFFFFLSLIFMFMELAEPPFLRPSLLNGKTFLASHLFHNAEKAGRTSEALNWLHWTFVVLAVVIAGGVLETRWGTPRFLVFYLLSVWGAAGVTLLTQYAAGHKGPSYGAASVALASLAAVGYTYPDHRLVRSVPPMKHFTWILIFLGGAGLAWLDLLSLSSAGGRGPWESSSFLMPQVSGVAFALLFLKLDPWLLDVVKRWQRRRAAEERERVVQIRHRVDRLLEKISAEGMESLTRDEKLFLRHASKHFKTE